MATTWSATGQEAVAVVPKSGRVTAVIGSPGTGLGMVMS
jgi:hypothetical protein